MSTRHPPCPVRPSVHLRSDGWCWWHGTIHEMAINEPTFEEVPVTTPLSAVPETAETAVLETFTRNDRAAFRQALKTMTIETVRDGLPVQPTLSDAIFKPLTRSRKPVVKLSISGNDTLDLDGAGGFDSLISGPGDGTVPTLDDGMVVEISGWGYVQKVGQEQTPKGESIVVVGLKLKQFGGLKITGEMYDPEADDA